MSTQRPPRRRSARLAFGNDDVGSQHHSENGPPVAKKTKTDESHTASNGAIVGDGGSTARKRVVSYDEEDDGFTFTRTRSKKAKIARRVPEAVSEEPSAILSDRRRASIPEKKVRGEASTKRKNVVTSSKAPDEASSKRKDAATQRRAPDEVHARRKNAVTESEAADEDSAGSRRRSARVAGAVSYGQKDGKDYDEAIEKTKEDAEPAGHPELSMSSKDTTTIALPFSDTPVIKRNKAFREIGSKGHRRSSTGLRGRRASSLIDHGSDALPHREVSVADFYKHIAGEGLSEPRRMKQLLTWCGTRALEDRHLPASLEDRGILAAQAVLNELLKEFGSKSEISDWLNREESRETPLTEPVVKKANPRNVANAVKIEELEKQVQRLQEERQRWETFFAQPASALTHQSDAPSSSSSSAPLQTTTSQHPFLSTAQETTQSLLKTLSTSSSQLEFRIDRFAHGIHTLERYQETADQVADVMLGVVAKTLEKGEMGTREQARTGELPVQEVLRSIGRLEAERLG